MKIIGALGVFVSLSIAATGAASAQSGFPEREIKLQVGFGPGGVTDVLARIVAEKMSSLLGQRVVVENKGGANGATATRSVARATPDGYTLIFNSSNMGVNLYGLKDPGYEWNDFVTIGGFAYAPLVMITNTASSKAKTLKDFVEFGRANPGALTYASFGPQSLQNVAAQRLNAASKINYREVPYKDTGPILTDLISGQINVHFGTPLTANANMKQPNIALFGVTDKKRLKILPDVPTFAELGYPVYDVFFAGIWAPAATPKPVVNKLREALAEAKKSSEITAALEKTGNLLYEGDPEQFDRDAREQALQYRDDFKRLGIEPQ